LIHLQETSFQEVQITGQALYARSRGVDDTFAAYANSAYGRLCTFQNRVYKVMQRGGCAWRRFAEAFDKIPAKSYERSFDGGGSNVDAHRNRPVRRRTWPVLAHNSCALYALYAILSAPTWASSVDNQALTSNANGAGLTFFERAMSFLLELKRTQASVIQEAAELCADRIARGGLVFLFGKIRGATAEALLARGVKPVVLPSHQFVGNTSAATQLEAFYEAYRKSLKHLFE
jgi:hypothetical protein